MDEPILLPAIPLPTAIDPLPPAPIAIPEPVFERPQEPVLEYYPVLLPQVTPSSPGDPSIESGEQSESDEPAQGQKAPKTKVPVKILIPQLSQFLETESETDGDPQPLSPRMTKISVPGTKIEIPIPEQDILITAATTAATASVVSVAATISVQQLAKKIKPIFDQILKRILKKKQKPHELLTFGRKRLVQRHCRRLPSESPVET